MTLQLTPPRELDDVRDLRDAFVRGLRPNPIETVAEWAERARYLPVGSTAEPGIWRTSKTPYLREILEVLSPHSPVEKVVLMMASQVGKSEASNCHVGNIIAKGLGPTMIVLPNLPAAKEYSRARIEKMVLSSPELNRILPPRSARDDSNQLTYKEFPGGFIVLRGAETASGLASTPIRNLIMDEVDRYSDDVQGEGNPVDLAIKRTSTFTRRKILILSTPVAEGTSKIAEQFAQTDQRYYVVPCPSCGTFQQLVWRGLKFERDKDGKLDPNSVRYVCCGCGELLEERHKKKMLAGGRWEATETPTNPDYRGYHLSSLYSPWRRWFEVAEAFLTAGRNPDKLKVWTNTDMAEVWKDSGSAPEWRTLWRRREPYDSDLIPAGVHILTVGVDAQRDHLEGELVGWGPGLESWSIDYFVIAGDTSTREPWQELEKLLTRRWKHENGGEIGLTRMAVDAGDGAHSAAAIYRWARPHVPRVLPVRGVGTADILVGRPRSAQIRKGRKATKSWGLHWPVGVSMAKAELYGWLRLEEPEEGAASPLGWCHFPRDRDEEWFQQLTSERRSLSRDRKGNVSSVWKVIAGRRNEGLDCRVYARAAAFIHGVDGWAQTKWDEVLESTRDIGDGEKPKTSRKRKVRVRRGYLEGGNHPWLEDGQ